MSAVNPSVNQYENCLRCHGTSAGKVTNPAINVRSGALPQPSLLADTLNLDGVMQGRSMGPQILCTDCHNSDDNREFGGVGPNGPHGSKWTHILERRYEFSQAPAPSQLITNLFRNPDLSVNGPYTLCGKCHGLAQIMAIRRQKAAHISFHCSLWSRPIRT